MTDTVQITKQEGKCINCGALFSDMQDGQKHAALLNHQVNWTVTWAVPPPPEPDCRTCAHFRYNNIKGGSCYNDEHWRIRCVDGNQYNPLIPIQLWRTK